MRERDVEAYLVRRVKERGGIAYKFTSPGRRSVPDRIVLFPGGVMRFVELKAPGQRPTPLQQMEHNKIRAMGYYVAVLDSKDAVDEWLFRMEAFLP